MKIARITITLFAVALLYSASAFARDANKAHLQLVEEVTVDGTRVDPGTYKVEWEGSGPTVQVTLLQGKQTVATFPARLKQENTSNNSDAYGSTKEPNGTTALTEIYVGGKPYVLEIQPMGTHQQPSNSFSR